MVYIVAHFLLWVTQWVTIGKDFNQIEGKFSDQMQERKPIFYSLNFQTSKSGINQQATPHPRRMTRPPPKFESNSSVVFPTLTLGGNRVLTIL